MRIESTQCSYLTHHATTIVGRVGHVSAAASAWGNIRPSTDDSSVPSHYLSRQSLCYKVCVSRYVKRTRSQYTLSFFHACSPRLGSPRYRFLFLTTRRDLVDKTNDSPDCRGYVGCSSGAKVCPCRRLSLQPPGFSTCPFTHLTATCTVPRSLVRRDRFIEPASIHTCAISGALYHCASVYETIQPHQSNGRTTISYFVHARLFDVEW